MTLLCINIKKKFSIDSLSLLRNNYNHKICYKSKYKFLNLKLTPSQSLANRLTKKSNFLKSYKIIKKFYYNFLLKKMFQKLPINCNFVFFYKKYYSFRDFDRVLFWKYNSLDCMFTNKIKKLKKKKQKILNYLFISGKKRIIFTINLVKTLILLNFQRKKKNLLTSNLTPLYDFIVNDKNNNLIKIKYRIYKQKLMKMQL